ncbi:MAG: hypothetical protein ACLRSW_11220 [Christensenellaceae bacterium]
MAAIDMITRRASGRTRGDGPAAEAQKLPWAIFSLTAKPRRISCAAHI